MEAAGTEILKGVDLTILPGQVAALMGPNGSGKSTLANTLLAHPDYTVTAGPVIPNQLPDPLGCWRSDHNYPHLVAAVRPVTLRDVSCSGATTADMTAPQSVLFGSNPPQLDALDPTVSTVSVQIGGNDIGFVEIVERCAALLPLGTPSRHLHQHRR